MIRIRCGGMPIEALTRNTRYRQEECTIIGMVVDVKTTTNGHRIAEIEDLHGWNYRALQKRSSGIFRWRTHYPR